MDYVTDSHIEEMAEPNTTDKTVSNNMELLLKEVSEKLSILIEKFDSNHEPIKQTLDAINQNFESINDKRQGFIDFGATSATNNTQLEKEISMKKNIIIRTWKRNLNERKQAFWNALKTENIVNIYKKWRQEENTIIMPRKFHIKKIAGEDETERAIRENLALQKFDAEIALLETRSTRYTQRFQNIDIKMEDEIKKISSGEVQNHLLKQWKKVTDEEEEKSEYIWTKKKVFYDDYAENYGNVELDRNEKPAQNKSLKPRSRYQHRNDKTYADVTMEKNNESARQRTNNQTFKSTQNNQRHHGNWNQNQRYLKPTTGRTHQRDQSYNPISNRQHDVHNDEMNNNNNNNQNNNNNNHRKPFLWRGKIQKYRWKSWA